jgi:muramidase (phage lysozyme)
MNPKVPAPAGALLNYIGKIEAPRGYDTVYGNQMAKMKKPLTTMTMKEILDQGKWRHETFGSSACGKYQFMDETLRSLARQLNLQASDVFTPDYQDWLAYNLLLNRGWNKWASGKMLHDDFMIQLAKEWASFPVPYDMKGHKGRIVKRGDSYYKGVGSNRDLVSASEVWLFLRDLQEPAQPDPIDPPLDTEPMPDDSAESLWAVLLEAYLNYMKGRTK